MLPKPKDFTDTILLRNGATVQHYNKALDYLVKNGEELMTEADAELSTDLFIFVTDGRTK